MTERPQPISQDDVRRLAQWNATSVHYRADSSVHELFREIAAVHSDHVAVACSTGQQTYAQLDRRSDEIAACLLNSGIEAEATVGVCLSRSACAVSAILGVLKAGASYVPLDPAFPAARIDFMIRDAGVKLVLSSTEHRGLLTQAGLTTIMADGELPFFTSDADLPLKPAALTGAYRRACIMYTSGSTGAPKGVQIEHRSIVRLVGKVDYVRLDSSTRFMLAAPLGFDASTLEIWGPLLNGGRVVVNQELIPTGRGIAQLVATQGVNTVWLTAALFNAIVDDDPRYFQGLRQLLVGGEALSPTHIRRALAALPEIELINGYGPTECTTFATTYSIPRHLPADYTTIPIGRPSADTTLQVLDDEQCLVPVGSEGELYIGGRGVARGYLGRPELNGERFVSNPLVPDEKLYRTGDLVRWRDDGVLEFVRRVDEQVKVRGFRIEPAEIEARLMELPQLKACAVVARPDGGCGQRLVAYVVPKTAALTISELRQALARQLPQFMVPSAFVVLDALPLTASGKLDRLALPKSSAQRPLLAQEFRAPADELEQSICAIFAEVIGLDRVGAADTFFDLGGDSLSALRVLSRLRQDGLGDVSAAIFFGAPTPASLAHALRSGAGRPTVPAAKAVAQHDTDKPTDEPLAIIGMGGRFPGARDVEQFWSNLCAGRESIRFFRDDELDPSISTALRADPAYVAARGVLDDVEMFDAGFFGISPLEAQSMDPQQRHFLETAWHALEHAGYVPESAPGRIGIFGGMYNASYFQRHLLPRPEVRARLGELQLMLANEKDYLTSRVAHKLGLTGPAVGIQTACSTSLVAVAAAMESLRRGECDIALAGGVAITCPPRSGYLHQEGTMTSADGHTRPFDASATGTVFSDAVAIVVLRRLGDARADRDTIYATLLGAAVNNDGSERASFTAPSPQGQAAVIAAAQDAAGIDARTVTYVETHGTATPLGDPVEIEGLTRAFRRQTNDTGFCSIGSLKGNVGHLVIAAGAASLIKTSLALARRTLPPSIGFERSNPKIEFANSPFKVQTTLQPWAATARRRAGVSSFGFGGTNCHVVLEEAPDPTPTDRSMRTQLLILSARDASALAQTSSQLSNALMESPGVDLADVAYTLQVGRRGFAHRRYVVARDAGHAARLLTFPDATHSGGRELGAESADFALLCPGQGSHYPRMAQGLYVQQPAFRTEYDRCCALIGAMTGSDPKALFFSEDPQALIPTSVTQPALFALEFSLAKLWMSWGVRPSALIGHCVGEIVCAALAEVMSIEDAVALVVERGRLIQALPAGSMLSVRLPAADLEHRLPPGVEIGAEDAPGLCVASGSTPAIEQLEKALSVDNVAARRLTTSHAFHSAMMDPAVKSLGRRLDSIVLSPPRIPILSTVTADWLTPELATSRDYWAENLRRRARFAPAAARLLQDAHRVLIEVGPRATLSALARQAAPGDRALPVAISSLGDSAEEEADAITNALGQAWSCGASIDWNAYWGAERRGRVPLPGYAFQGTRHWVDAPAASAERAAATPDSAVPVPEPPATPADRREDLIASIRTLVEEVCGLDVSAADPGLPWFEMGLDSLALTQLALEVQRVHSIKVTFRQVMEEFTSMTSLAAMLDSRLSRAPAAAVAAEKPPAMTSPDLRQVIDQQLQLMAQQLALLGGTTSVPAPANAPAPPPVTDEAAVARYDVRTAFGAIARIHTVADELTALQRTRLDALIGRYNARTRRSKEYTAYHRPHLADPRVVSGFRPLTKELTYQLVIERSCGSHVWDLDGNEYIDVLSGFGMSLFGWQPQFIREALHRQIDRGYEIGPQHVLAGEVAELFCRLTGAQRAAFCNTGSEAVVGAMRIARTVTGRSTVAVFSGAYHGIFDEAIVRGTPKLKSIPAAPGILPSAAQNILVLDFGTPESLAILRSRAHELAAVLVEPVQSRRPDFQPVAFLRELRSLTEQSGALLIFDEVITGFRAHPRGAQGLFDLQADIGCYGKVVGGGMPIGVIAGKRQYMDALDGGHWEYGDSSMPTVGVTYFAGTFVRHPMALAAAKSVLEHLIDAGPTLQQELTARTAAITAEINAFMIQIGAPLRLNTFASLWRHAFTEELPYGDLIYVMLRDLGIHVVEQFPCFLTTAHTSADIAAIVTAYKQAALEMQASGFFAAARDPRPTYADGVRTVPTTEPQREVWLVTRLGPEASLAYNESVSISLEGALNIAALQGALRELPRRHDALRSSFSADGMHLRIPGQAPELEVAVHDLGALGAEAGAARLQALRERHVTEPFDLENGPLIRADLVRLADERHILIFTGHHIVLDGWSYWVIVKDLGRLYAAAIGKPSAPLVAAPSFAQFASHHAEARQSAEVQTNEKWWTERFADAVPVLELPTDHPRPARRSTRAGREDHMLPADLVMQLKKLGTQLGSSLFATMLAGFDTLLHRLTGLDDIVVGIPAAGQNAEGLRGLVGHCVNMLPLRARLHSDLAFDQLVRMTRSGMLDAYEHQNVTFGRLLQLLPIARDSARLPLISVMFNIDQALSGESGALPGLALTLQTNPRKFENFELFINASDLGTAGMRLECQFNADLFDRDTIERWLAAYETLLRAVVAAPCQTLGRLALLSADEQRLLDSWNHTAADYPRESRIEDLIAVAAAEYPAQPAVRVGERVLTYHALLERAYGIAACIRRAGAVEDARVGLLLDRDEHLLPSLLGALCSGVPYVPLDPALPAERLKVMIEDAGVRVIVSTQAVVTRLPDVTGTVAMIAAEETLPMSVCLRVGSADDIAYVIYTSGSTGQPKGVCVPHRNVVNFLTTMARRPGLSHRDRLAAVTTLSLDIAVLELLLPLTMGAEVVVVPRDVSMDGIALRDLLDRSRTTLMQATPATWRLLLAANWSGGSTFRAFCGGESLDRELAATLLARVGELWNLYGPTETTIWSVAGRVERVDRPIAIGTPIANTAVHVVNAQLQRQAVGVIGEICIGGVGVANGYLNRPELNAERFVIDSHLGRLYRTGDLGRWVRSGQQGVLECLGRTDFQVKIRGYRVELGEIEAVLATHPAVSQAVVVASREAAGDGRLVAYLVTRGEPPAEPSLRAWLARTLPEYMLPQRFLLLPSLPLMPNGKLDRKALLPAFPLSTPEAPSTIAATATPLQQELLRAYGETLSRPQVGLNEDFFQLGGSSLIAAQMAARLSRQLGIMVPLRVIFEHPTVAKLAAWIDTKRSADSRQLSGVQRRQQTGPAPLSLMQQRVWYLEQLAPGRTVFNLPTAHRLRGKLDVGILNAAYAAMVQRQSIMRTIITVADGQPVQLVLDQVDSTIPFVDLSMLPAETRGADVCRRLRREVDETIDLSSAPLVRTRLYKLSDVEHVMLFMPHHAVFDGWSLDLFYQEMAEWYGAIENKREPRLPELQIDYADFSVWLNDWLSGEELDGQLQYWRRKLEGATQSLNIPVDRPRPAQQSGFGDTVWMRIPPATVQGLRKLSVELGATLNMLLLSAWTMLLHQLTGQDEIMVGTPVRGRNLPEFEHLLGFFVNALPLRLKVDAEQSFAQFLQAVRTECVEAFGYPDVPFEHLVRVLDLPRDESRFPLYQAYFSYQDGRERRSDWGSLRHEDVPIFQPSSAQDIGLWFLEGAGGLVGGINYNIDIIDNSTAVRLHDRYLAFLEAILANPYRTLRSLTALPAAEREQLMQFNDLTPVLPEATSLVQYLGPMLQAGGNQLAIRSGAQTRSYAELEAASSRMANALSKRAVGPGDVVALMLGRSPDLITAMLAVWKVGAAYLPLDPALPAARIEYMLADSGARLVVADDDAAPPAQGAVDVLRLDALLSHVQGDAERTAAVAVDADALAYLIYTSGSTGKPKGVRIAHRAVINLLESMRREPGLKAGARLAAVTTFSFDIALLELLLPLCVGGETLQVGREDAADGHALRRLLEQERVDAMQATPATWRLLIESGWRGGSGFKALCGGEAVPIEVAEALLERCGELWNLYGPTETTIWSTCARIEAGQGEISIGKPIANTQVWVLDERGELAPMGVPGEICIGGAGVALGYHNLADLTAARFVPDRFSPRPGARLYRTGDIGRWCSDGRLQHLGRTDLQVKVRGYRIEPGEIEAALARYPGIEQAVVVAHEQGGADARLIAYWTGSRAELPAAELDEQLRAELPEYMVPASFIRLDKLPLTANGKVDRRALPTPAAIEATQKQRQLHAPRTDSERLVADVWCKLLRVAQVRTADNFLDLGGHSLLVMHAVAMLETQTGMRLSPRVFIYQTLETIAAELDRALGARPDNRGSSSQKRKRRLFQRFANALKKNDARD